MNRRYVFLAFVAFMFLLVSVLQFPSVAAANCASPANEIVAENCEDGTPASEWDIERQGDLTIQGFADGISVNQGETVNFKIDTDAIDYDIDIYRLGYYGGDGARLVHTIEVDLTTPQVQPACLTDEVPGPHTGLTDCGNWAVSSAWSVPANAVSGIYIAKLTRNDTDGASHIVFIVRDDDGASDLLFQTSDTTWQAYNQYGGNSLYVGQPAGRGYKVSYNRPFTTRSTSAEDWLFNAEYPMVRWLEQNGYDVSYFTGVDTDRFGAELLEHNVFMSVGHDEYWSGDQRANVEAARDAGVNLAFFSSNEIFWKTRWENSIDGSNTSHRTLVSYKETRADAKIDPEPDIWTGTWRDPREFNPEGGQPENALTGQIFTVNSGDFNILVPAADGKMRFWRNTDIADLTPEQTAVLPDETLGYEWDEPLDNGFQPDGLIKMSTTSVSVNERIQDYGSTYGPGQATHHLVMYRADSGALVFGSGTLQWSWGLDINHDRVPPGVEPDSRMQQATVNLFADMGVQPATLQVNLVTATESTDTTAPTATITSPLTGSAVEVGTTNLITGTATDTGGGVVGGVEVSTDNGTIWHPANGRENWTYEWIPSALGETTILARATDDSANLGAVSAGETVEVEPRDCPCSIWNNIPLPDKPNEHDATPIEVGVKFRSDIDGYITAIRFYKGNLNTGIHTAHLWDNNGNRLSEATFTGESASGWQEVLLTAPVAITANTTYVATYFSPNGYYAEDTGYFTSLGFGAAPLHALSYLDPDGPNGVYDNGPSGFPESSVGNNYWVDVVFTEDVGPDTFAPVVTNVVPANGASSVNTGANINVTFSEAMDISTITDATIELRDGSSNLVAGAVTYSIATRTATFDPTSALDNLTVYTLTVKSGLSGVKDLAGNPLAIDFTASFTSAAPPPPPPDEGPGGPILVLAHTDNPFGRYYAEILRAEGLNAFTVSDISAVNATTLLDYDVIILGEMQLSAPQVTMLGDWVNAGGNLIAMRPDNQLASLLGLTDDGANILSNAYLLVDTSASPGAGIVDETIQYHGAADLYTLNGASAIAMLYSDATTVTAGNNPAVTLHSVGANGGQAAAFTYDLARSIVYTRQGNPAWAGQSRDGQEGPIRSDNLFFGGTEPDWVDLSKVDIPQADEQQRLLANLILGMNMDNMPLPRFWYFPRGEKAVILMTGDDHAAGGTDDQFDYYKSVSPIGCSVVDWECIRASSYIYPGTPISAAQAFNFELDGFEIGVHFNTGCANYTPASLEAVFVSQFADWQNNFPQLAAPVSNRTHCIAWSDWVTHAVVEYNHGIRLDTNYYYWPPSWVNNVPGVFTGSAMPMRFADTDGTMVDVYQAATQMTDESGQTYPFTANTLLDRALGAEGYYGVYTTNMHTDSTIHVSAQAITQSAITRGVPVVSGRQLLTWLDGRNGSSFGAMAWNESTDSLNFTVSVGAGANGIQAMLPMQSAVGVLTSIKLDSVTVPFTTQTIKGVEYAFFNAAAGTYEASYAPDTDAPVISNVTALPNADGTALITWTTDENADSLVEYGTSEESLTLTQSNSGLTTAHSITLTGLAPDTTYYYRVTSVDAASNSATSSVETFTQPAASLIDTTSSDFGLGSGVCSTEALTGDGEVTLPGLLSENFNGTTLPSGWHDIGWSNNGASSTFAGGLVTADGTRVTTTTTFGPGSILEFEATFGGGLYQHVGFGAGDLTTSGTGVYDALPIVIFSTSDNGAQVYARVISSPDFPLGANLIGSAHVYRLVWNANNSFDFYVDGTLRTTQSILNPPNMRVAISDLTLGGATLSVNWLRILPYVSPCTFTSRVLDAGSSANWGAATWTASVPTDTSLEISVRTGNTPSPDGTWTAFAAITNGATVGGSSQYIQYQAVLATTDTSKTPALEQIAFGYNAGEDTNPPLIINRTPAPDAVGVATNSNIVVQFSEPMNAATLNAASFTLQEDGGDAVPGTITLDGLTVTFDPADNLIPNAVYTATLSGSVTDLAGNPLGADVTWSFTTQAAEFVDTTSSDFSAGTVGTCAVLQTGDGALALSPILSEDFNGTTLPSGWTSTSWEGAGSTTVAGGLVTVDGQNIHTNTSFTPSKVLEFTATFGSSTFQHVGFVIDTDSNQPWAIFGTADSSTELFARTDDGSGGVTNTPIAGVLNTPHTYRIEWTAASTSFYVDGSLVATHTVNLSGNMFVMASDYSAGGANVSVDALRVLPYSSPCTFESRIFDAGSSANWGNLLWTAQTPVGTSVALSVRTGDTPDGTWTDFAPIAASGDSINENSRYIQYRAVLSTTDTALTPILERVEISYNIGADNIPPTITNRTPAPDAVGVAVTSNIVVQFSEPMNAATLNAASFTLQEDGGDAVPGTVTLDGLTATFDPADNLLPNTLYTVTVSGTVADVNGNELGSDSTWDFTTQAAEFVDTTSSDFSAGTVGTCAVLSTGDSALALSPTLSEEFNGTTLPSGWHDIAWDNGATTSVFGGGLVTVNGTRVTTTSSFGPGSILEFEATFGTQTFQHVGFGTGDLTTNGVYSILPLAIFSTSNTGAEVYARIGAGDIGLGADLLGTTHIYRLVWNATSFDFYVDGVYRATQNSTVSDNMRVAISDFVAGGASLSVNWIRLLPYISPCTFESRIFDAGSSANWGNLSWTAQTPVGTSVALTVRTGDTPTPDGTWTDFAPIAASGDSMNANSRYIQYRAVLSTTDTALTPILERVEISYNIGADNIPPTITNRTPTPNATGVSLSTDVTVTLSEAIDAGTIDATNFTLQADGSGTPVDAVVTYDSLNRTATLNPTNDLELGTLYHVTVSSTVTDLAGNALGAADTWSFTTQLATLVDTTVADFSQGTVGTCAVLQTGDGAVALSPTLSEEFNGTTLPSGWTSTSWEGSGSTNIAGGLVTVDGQNIHSNTAFAPGHVLEFTATFGSSTFQHVGFVSDVSSNEPWAMFGTNQSSTALYARTHDGSTFTNTEITGVLDAPHTYRIEWTAGSTAFYVDGSLIITHTVNLPGNMFIMVSDFLAGSPSLSVDSLRMSPYISPCIFDSRIFNAGGTADWGTLSWTAQTPSGTSVALSVRTGNTPIPDGTWSAFTPITNGGSIGASSQYLQYRAELSATNTALTPVLERIEISYIAGADTIPPHIINRTPAPNATDVPVETDVTVEFDESVQGIDGTTFYLRQHGSGSNILAVVSYNNNIATLNPDSDLALGVQYNVTLSGTISDANSNALGSDVTWSFTTELGGFSDTTAVDFGAGTVGTCYITPTGELILSPTLSEEFSGSTLPSGWSTESWNSGSSATVSGGLLTVDGLRASTDTYYSVGRSIEFVATFGGGIFANVGFGETLATGSESWAMIGTTGNGSQLLARTNDSVTAVNQPIDTPVSGAWLTTPQHYRIVWNASSVDFYINGLLVHSQFVTITTNMRPVASDLTTGGGTVQVGWLRMTPYNSPCSFESRVFDAGASANWQTISWVGQTPTNTTLALEIRTGDSPAPDGTWSDFAAVTNGGSIGQNGRYAQYRATLTTSDFTQTPMLEQVNLAYSINTAPTALPDSYTVAEGETLTIDAAEGVLDNDSDVDSLSLNAVLVSDVSHGTLDLNADGSFEYLHDGSETTSDSFTYKANDGSLDSNTVTVTITITPVNDAPTTSGIDDVTVDEDADDTTINLYNVFADAEDADTALLYAVDTNTNPLLVTAGIDNGVLTLEYTADAFGSAQITVSATDTGTLSIDTTFTVTVNALNDAPVLDPIGSRSIAEGAAQTVTITASDIDSPSLTFTAVDVPPFANFVDNGDNTATLTLNPGFTDAGNFPITVTVSDGDLDDSETLTISVGNVNGPPTLAGIGDRELHEGDVTSIPLSATDPDGNSVILSGSNLPDFADIVDNGDGTGTLQLEPGYADAGIYHLTITAADTLGLTDEEIITVTVNNTNRAPVITAAPSATTNEGTTITVNVSATDPDDDAVTLTTGARPDFITFTDNGDGTGTLDIAPDYDDSGTYIVSINATDGALSVGQNISIEIVNVDIAPPVITLLGDNPLTLEVGAAYIEPGATALDDLDGNLTAEIAIDSSAVNTTLLGTYSVTYNVSDNEGNAAIEVTRTVNVVDTTAPIITLLGDNPLTVEVGSAYIEAGAAASDNYDGDVTADIVIDSSAVNTTLLGTYAVTYNVSDNEGNAALEVTRTVNVVDTTAPVITLLGDNPLTVEVGSAYIEAGAAASDNYDGDVTADIVIDSSAVNTTLLGTYAVTYNVSDNEGNAAIEVTRTVNVVDTTAPIITLLGDNPLTLQVGSPYIEAGAAASDNYDGDLTADIVIDSSAVNTTLLGTYTVTYNVSDNEGNAALEVTRTVNVESFAQTITLMPNADTLVKSDTPTSNFGSLTYMRLITSSAVTFNDYFKFNVMGITGAVQSAKLRLYSYEGRNQFASLYGVSNNYLSTTTPWLENGLNWNNAPALSGLPFSIVGPIANNTWVEFDVTAIVSGNGTYSFGLRTSGNNSTFFYSKENAQFRPELVIEVGGSTVNTPPTISDVANQTVNLNTTLALVNFTVGDTETPASSLVMSATSSNTTLVPNANILLGGSDATRTVSITPASGQTGTTTITLTVTDAGGLTAADTFVLNVTPVSGATTIILTPNADTLVKSDTPTSNFGSLTYMRLITSSAVTFNDYFKFNVMGITGAVQSAKLRLYSYEGRNQFASLYGVSNNYLSTTTPWLENGLNWNNAPALSGLPFSIVGPVANNTWVEFDVTAIVSGNGTYSFGLRTSGNNSIFFYSKENAQFRPELVIEVGGSTVNTPPTISDVANQTVNINTSLGPINFTVNDLETAATSLAVSATSSNTTLVPNVNITLGGSGSARTVSILPASGETGTTTITLTVTDGGSLVAADTFDVTVEEPAPVPPNADAGPDQTVTDSDNNGSELVTLNASGSTDDGTITSYVWTENGNPLTTGIMPAVNLSVGTHTITLTVTDDDTLTDTDTVVITVNPASSTTTITLTPNADTMVRSDAPTSTAGSATYMRLRTTAASIYHDYLKFDVSGINGTVQSATLRLYSYDGRNQLAQLFSVSNNYLSTTTPWLENGLNWNNAPALSGPPFATSGPIANNTWVEFDVTAIITGDGVYSFGLRTPGNNSTFFYSKENAQFRPELVIEVEEAPLLLSTFSDFPADTGSYVEITPVDNQNSLEGDAVSLPVVAVDTSGGALRYDALGLPDGPAIDPASGIISGTITAGASVNSPYTVTVTFTAGDGLTETTSFTWTVGLPVITAPSAVVDITSGGFTIANTGNVAISSVSINLSTALYPDMAFDPNGTAGDSIAKCFAPLSGGDTTGLLAPANPCVDGFASPRGNGGFDTLNLAFASFEAGESFSFDVEVDPLNITADSGAGAVSGIELIGTTVTVTFANGTTLVSATGRIPDSSDGSRAYIGATIAQPVITVTSGMVSDPAQTVQVSAPADSTVVLWVIESALTSPLAPSNPFAANEALAISEYTAVVGADGTVDIPVTLSDANPNGRLYYITGAVRDANGHTGATSNVTVVLLNALPTIIYPGDQTGTENAAVSLAVIASDPDGALRFDAVGLPAGLVIDPATGLISGLIAEGASLSSPYIVTVSVVDSDGASAQVSFNWIVADDLACPLPDLVGDPCNPDEDADTITDDVDVCPFDALHDGIGNPCNHDEDADAFLDDEDVCPFESGIGSVDGCAALPSTEGE